jgi:hypothetical protein
MAKDYLASRTVEQNDALQHGVKGMKWGIRNGVGQAAAKAGKPELSKPVSGESSQQRYERLQQDVKHHGAKALSDADLKFMNARADAIKKVEALNAQNKNWVADATKKALKNTVNQELAKIAAGVAAAYISGPIVSAAKSAVK